MNKSSSFTVYKIVFVLPLLILLFASAFEAYAQPGATQARHETDAQTSTTITLTANLGANYTCVGGCLANWSITIGGPAGVISSVVGAAGSNTVIVNFTPAVGIGQAVVVNHTNDGTINNIVNLASQNNRVTVCTDFTWFAVSTPTPPCAPVDPITKMIFSVVRGARNSSVWNINNIRVRAHWIANGAVPFNDLVAFQSNNAGLATPNTYFITGDAASSAYVYPANDPVCGYTATYRILLNGVTSCAFTNPGQQVTYASHNNDDTGLGADVILQPTILNSDLVCLGSNANMTFTDNTDLNCNPTVAPIPTNDAVRWVRVVYGSTDLGGGNTATSNIPNIRVAGVPVTNATGNLLFPGGYVPPVTPFGVPDPFGVVQVNAPVTTARGILNLITTSSPVGQVVGQRFWVRLDYWNVCNPYDGAGDIGNLRRFVENDIIIVDRPAPPAASLAARCETQANGNFNITATGVGGAQYTWYLDAGLTTILQGPSADNTFNPVTDGPVGNRINKSVTGSQTFHRYVVQTVTTGQTCTSLPTDVVIRIDDTNQAGTIAHPLGVTPVTICSGTDPVTLLALMSAPVEAPVEL
jgi:hypothetical protein